MKLDGFIGAAYTLDSVNVDAQRCVNLYPEAIDSRRGKSGQVAYLRSTPGLDLFQTVGDGPIRNIHRDAIGRIFVVSGSEIYRVSKRAEWEFTLVTAGTPDETLDQSTDIDAGTDILTAGSNSLYTGQKVQVSSSGTLPTGLSAATDYWIIEIATYTFKLAATLADANSGTGIDITAVGSGMLSVVDQTPNPDTATTSIKHDDHVDYTANEITIASHGLFDGMRVYLRTFATPMPSGLVVVTTVGPTLTYYFVKVVDSNTIKLCTSIANVVTDTEVDLSVTSGSWYVEQLPTSEQYASDYSAAAFSTSSGAVIARSAKTGSTDTTATTVLTDGTASYVIVYGDFGFEFAHGGDYESFFGSDFLSTHVAWIDGYYILNELNTNKFWVSGLSSVIIDPLDFASSEGSPDLIMGHIECRRVLWIFNEKSTEVFANSGNADFPFERIPGGFIEVGCVAKYSIAKIDGTVLWLGRSEDGEGIVYAAKGLTPQRVSTHAIEQTVDGYADISSATAYTYQSKGHFFYVLTFAEATWVYDLSTGLWHERAYTNAGTLERHRVEAHCFDISTGMHLVGDYETGKVYQFSETTYSDNGDAITRLRTSPHISSGNKRLFYNSLWIDMETGVGLDGDVQGSSPTVMLDFSDDGGHTWSSESWALADNTAGSIGEYRTRVRWRRLGRSRDRIFRFKMTDPVKCTLIDAEIDVEMGAN